MKKILTVLLVLSSLYATAQIEDGCVARYFFNNGTAEDEIGENDGVVFGATLTTDRFGHPKKAFYFDGINDYIDFGDKEAFRFGSGDFSISIWIKPDGDTPRSAVINKMNSNANDNWNQYAFFYKNLGGIINFNIFGSEGPDQDRPLNTNSYNADEWNHIVLVHTTEESAVYVNGILEDVDNTDISGSTFDITGFPLIIGVRLGERDFYYKGKIDDVCLFNRILSSNEINTLYNSTNPLVDPLTIVEDRVGIGTNIPKSRLEVAEGNVFVSKPTKGFILTDNNGGCWLINVNSSGQLISTSITCPD